MSFASHLNDLRACEGVLMTAIADRDGIQVESWGGRHGEVDEIVAEYSTFLREVASANRELQLGDLEQVVVAAERRVAILTSITKDYFLLTVLTRDGNTGKARYASRIAAFRLRGDFL
ncbi:MAG TPA: roadblock/LC7 domain-containing protein [Thermoanaerobaculaceae bacterium]|nr:roadblock/LC7 domain-containing protein [Thermoanaerobaculaceae bacterium]HRS17125.1 roadblock/LC7 domain-containing protein [Thermoanaerobaculaceae bacterium]